MPREQHFVELGHPSMAGNWWPFPPPAPGFYHLRRLSMPQHEAARAAYLPNRRVYTETTGGRLQCMGRRVSRMRPEDGWQFQFLRHPDLEWRPHRIDWDLSVREEPRRVGATDISGELPVAYSREEALYMVSQFPVRWPAFVQVHIEFTETRKAK